MNYLVTVQIWCEYQVVATEEDVDDDILTSVENNLPGSISSSGIWTFSILFVLRNNLYSIENIYSSNYLFHFHIINSVNIHAS